MPESPENCPASPASQAPGQVRQNAETGPPRRIVLTGFMGSGKSTIGRLLARQLRWRFIDADAEIERAAGASIPEIFSRQGESWFRELEHRTIAQLLDTPQMILALGGGAIEDERTRRLLLQSRETRLVHLEASLETVLKRCSGTDAFRPVLADRANLQARFELRLPLYRQAHLTLPVDSHPPYVIINAILANTELTPAL